MAAAGRKVAVDMHKIWLARPEVYPVIACMGIGLGFFLNLDFRKDAVFENASQLSDAMQVAYSTGRHMTSNPDISVDRERRGSVLKDTLAEGDAWKKTHNRFIAKDVSKIQIFKSYEMKYQ